MRDRFLAAFLLAVLACGCGHRSSSLYPLTEGEVRHYQLTVKSQQGTQTIPMTVTVMPQRELDKLAAVPLKVESAAGTGFLFVSETSDGSLAVAAEQAPTDASPVISDPPKYILKAPVRVGTSWQQAAKTHLQRTPLAFNETIQIASIAETVTVPAGSFSDCVRVDGNGNAKNEYGWTISIEDHDWYCPGVGWVRSLHAEKTDVCNACVAETAMQLMSLPAS